MLLLSAKRGIPIFLENFFGGAAPQTPDSLFERNERGARDEAPSEWSENNSFCS